MGFFAWLKRNRGGIFAAAILLLVIIFDFYVCPFYAFCGIPCPACGVTRALLCLIELDMMGYLEYNAMALPLVSVVCLFLFKRNVKKISVADIYAYAVLGLNFVYYIFRLTRRF